MGVAPSIWLNAIQQGVPRAPLNTHYVPGMVTITSISQGGQR
jgi:hypothetical protein